MYERDTQPMNLRVLVGPSLPTLGRMLGRMPARQNAPPAYVHMCVHSVFRLYLLTYSTYVYEACLDCIYFYIVV